MFEIITYVHVYGEKFSPRAAEKLTNIFFTEKTEPGDIGNHGRYKGKKIPIGRADIILRGDNNQVIISAINIICSKIDDLRSVGAESIVLHLAINYNTQCNLDFPPSLLLKISSLGIPLTISCIDIGDRD